MRRIFKWAAGLIVSPIVALLAPILWIETTCRGTVEQITKTSLLPPEHHRPLNRTLMTFPEWHIVHAYDDYARVIETSAPHDFHFLQSITGFWGSLCQLNRAAGPMGRVDSGTKQMVYLIGVSFTAELLAKAAYEETIGRLFSRNAPTDVDQTSAQQARAYANFLQQVPWYKWDFTADRAALKAIEPASLRDRERQFALGIEYGVKAAYANVIAAAVANVGADQLTLRMIVTDISPADLAKFQDVAVIAEIPAGIIIETPRYRALTHILYDMAQRGANFVEIAGNDTIMFTTITKKQTRHLPVPLYSAPRQGYGDTRHLNVVPVPDLAATLRDMTPGQLEHIHDY